MFKTLVALSVAILSLLFSVQSIAQDTATGPHITINLLSELDGLQPGATQSVAVQMLPDEHWHTYWRNPGDSGEPPVIEWTSSQALNFGEIQWPLPVQIPVAHLVNYGYPGAHLLMVPLTVPDNLDIGDSVAITADLSWLVCKENCIPGWATLSITLPVADNPAPTSHAALFSDTRNQLPQEQLLSAEFELSDSHIAVSLDALSDGDWQLFPFDSDVASHSAVQQVVVDKGKLNVLLQKSDYFSAAPTTLQFLISDGERGYYVDAQPVTTELDANDLPLGELMIYAGMALLGGLILNIMPCVLPILSIKALSLQQQNKASAHNWFYLLGVLVCFNAFAISIIVLQLGGAQLGWGFHLQSPTVIAFLAFLFTFIGLVLLDVFQVGSGLAGLGNSLVTGENAKSHFFTGVLAVIVASPCTAPFMAAALGVALTQSAFAALVIFNALALGFALPLTLLLLSRRAQAWLPKPGLWMETFKHALAFPMFATVAWLAWVYAGQTGAFSQFVLLCALILFSFFAWLSGKSRSNAMKHMSTLGLVIIVVATLLQPQGAPLQQNTEQAQAYAPDTLQTLKNNGDVVLVNMTADWCITCKVNEHVALTSDTVKQTLAQSNVHYLVGDWTNKNDAIYQFLQQYDRAGVPLYVVYAGNNYVNVLPQVLTPDIVVDSINEALQERSNVN